MKKKTPEPAQKAPRGAKKRPTHKQKAQADAAAVLKKMAKKLKGEMLNAKEEAFCQYYASSVEFFGNGTQSYIEAFDVVLYEGKRPRGDENYMTYLSVRHAAHDLLTKANILARINEIYEAHGLNDTFVDKQLERLIVQDAEPSVKIKAIAEYNKLKSRITKEVDVRHTFANDPRSDEELDRAIAEAEAFFKKK